MTGIYPIPAEVEGAVAEVIAQEQLSRAEHRFSVIGAWESGSRAWGMHHGNSDFDVRFIYCHIDQFSYISIGSLADTIQLSVDHPTGKLDVVGWDLRKALSLAVRGNPTAHEWITSCPPYRSVASPDVRYDLLRGALAQLVDHEAAANHYLGIARGHFQKARRHLTYVMMPDLVPNQVKAYKALLYVVRALAIRVQHVLGLDSFLDWKVAAQRFYAGLDVDGLQGSYLALSEGRVVEDHRVMGDVILNLQQLLQDLSFYEDGRVMYSSRRIGIADAALAEILVAPGSDPCYTQDVPDQRS
jgi:hypothetical protein